MRSGRSVRIKCRVSDFTHGGMDRGKGNQEPSLFSHLFPFPQPPLFTFPTKAATHFWRFSVYPISSTTAFSSIFYPAPIIRVMQSLCLNVIGVLRLALDTPMFAFNKAKLQTTVNRHSIVSVNDLRYSAHSTLVNKLG